jgi:hypothetical protein
MMIAPGRWHGAWLLCAALTAVASAGGIAEARSKRPKPAPAAEYVGHVMSFAGAMFVLHVDAFTPNEDAEKVAIAGREGNPDAIRTALGKLDAGFIKIGTSGYRVAYARRREEAGQQHIVLVLRNELPNAGRGNGKFLVREPLAAVDAWIPPQADGKAVISEAAVVVFRSPDDLEITDWGDGVLLAFGLRERKR